MNKKVFIKSVLMSTLLLTACSKPSSFEPTINNPELPETTTETIEEPKYSVLSTSATKPTTRETYDYDIQVLVHEDLSKEALLEIFNEIKNDSSLSLYETLEVEFLVSGEADYHFFFNSDSVSKISISRTSEEPNTSKLYSIDKTNAPTPDQFEIAYNFLSTLMFPDYYPTLNDVYDKTITSTNVMSREEIDESVEIVNNYFSQRNSNHKEKLEEAFALRNE